MYSLFLPVYTHFKRTMTIECAKKICILDYLYEPWVLLFGGFFSFSEVCKGVYMRPDPQIIIFVFDFVFMVKNWGEVMDGAATLYVLLFY